MTPSDQQPTLFHQIQSRYAHYPEEGVRYSRWMRSIIIMGTILFCAFLFPQFERQFVIQYHAGAIWHSSPVIAEYSFPIYKPDQLYQQQIQQIKQNTPPVFLLNSSALIETEAIIQGYLDNLQFFTPIGGTDTIASSYRFSPMVMQALRSLTPAEYREFSNRIRNTVLNFQKTIYSYGYINLPKKSIQADSIVVRISATEELWLPKNFVKDVNDYITEAALFIKRQPGVLEREILDSLMVLLHIPNLIYSADYTQELQKALINSVPRTIGFVQKGETIVRKGERIDSLTALKLENYYRFRSIQEPIVPAIFTFLSNFGQAFLICSILFLYLAVLRKRIFFDNYQLFGICVTLVIISFLSFLSTTDYNGIPVQYLIVMPAATMLLAILYDSRTAFYSTVTMALLLAGIRAGDYHTALAMLFASTLAGFTVRDLQSRGQLFKSIGFIFVGFAIAILAFAADQMPSLNTLISLFTLSFLNAVFSPVLTFGTLYVLERTTNITTDLKIAEYDTLEHPLLQQLAERAPGTYQHTLNVARLAEVVARAIGANVLLTRVGAYYHDIGKIPKAEYFIENQIGIENKHERLSPWQSAAIIRNHVKDGIELGKQYGLPQPILDFIPQHHGTMLIQYFYQKAVEQAHQEGKDIHEEDFRYPGPKPQTKEATILMIVDGVEAMARTLPSYDAESIDQAIRKLIEDRCLDGQFDESPLSFKEIQIIRQVLTRHLLSMGHPRIQYPNQEKAPSDNKTKPKARKSKNGEQ